MSKNNKLPQKSEIRLTNRGKTVAAIAGAAATVAVVGAAHNALTVDPESTAQPGFESINNDGPATLTITGDGAKIRTMPNAESVPLTECSTTDGPVNISVLTGQLFKGEAGEYSTYQAGWQNGASDYELADSNSMNESNGKDWRANNEWYGLPIAALPDDLRDDCGPDQSGIVYIAADLVSVETHPQQ